MTTDSYVSEVLAVALLIGGLCAALTLAAGVWAVISAIRDYWRSHRRAPLGKPQATARRGHECDVYELSTTRGQTREQGLRLPPGKIRPRIEDANALRRKWGQAVDAEDTQ